MLDDGEEAPVGFVKGQLCIRVLWRRNASYTEQAPGQGFAHLGRVIVHCFKIDPCHAGQPVAVPSGIKNYPPRPFWRAQCAVSAMFERESLCAEQNTFAVYSRNTPEIGRIGLPHVDPGTVGRLHWLCQDTMSWAESSDLKHVQVRSEELPFPQRRADVVLDRVRGNGRAP